MRDVTAVAGTLLLVAACAHAPPENELSAVEALLDGRVEQRLEGRRASGTTEPVPSAVDALLEAELTRETAVQIALLENASLHAAYEELGVARADLLQAGRLPNPVLSASARVPEGGGRANLELSVVQSFLDLLLRPARKRLATTELERVRLRVADRVLELAGEVEAAYYEAVAAEQVVEIRELIERAAEASHELSVRLREAGNASELDVARERDLFESSRVAVGRARASRLSSREELTRKLGLARERSGFGIPSRLPDLPQEDPPIDRLEASAEEARLDLEAARKEVELRAEALGITRKWRGLAVAEVGADSEREADAEWLLGPEITLELPLFDRGRPRVERQIAELRRSRQELRALAIEVQSTVRELHAQLQFARQLAEHYREVVIPLRERIVRLTQMRYDYMLAGAFELLAAKRSEFDAYEEYVGSVRDYWVARARLQRALGGVWPDPPSTDQDDGQEGE